MKYAPEKLPKTLFFIITFLANLKAELVLPTIIIIKKAKIAIVAATLM